MVDSELISLFMSRQTQVYALEASAPLVAVFNLLAVFANRDAYVSVDNEPAVSTLIRGATTAEDVAHLAEIWHFFMRQDLLPSVGRVG